MRLRNVFGILLSLFALVIVGCGGGGSAPAAGASGTAVSGAAVKGPITGGTIQVFEIISSGTTNPRGAGLTAIPRFGTTPIPGASAIPATNGSFAVTIPSNIKNGGLLFKLTGGTYTDEATATAGISVNTQTANKGLQAAFSNISGAVKRGVLTVNITPFTDLGVRALGATSPSDVNIASANAKVATTFSTLLKGANILTTAPVDPSVAPPVGTTAAQLSYTAALATISQLTNGGANLLDTVLTNLLPEVQAGVLTTSSAAVTQAEVSFLTGPNNKITGAAAAQGLTVTATPATVTTASTAGTGVPIAATVKLNNVNVPDGTQVKFAIKSGVGGSLSAASATTTGGIASVTLTSATDAAAYVVTATAGGIPVDTALITFANPNKPGAITLTAAPSPGAINNLGPVTLTATVTPVGPAGTLPVGTTVNFNILTGAGGTISAVTTTNASGVATATLNSTTVGTLTVNATAGTAPIVTSNTVSVPFVSLVTSAVVKISTTGILPVGTTIGGIHFILNYSTNKGLSIVDSGVVQSSPPTGTITANLPTINTATAGIVNVAFVNSNSSVIGTTIGQFAILTFTISPGCIPGSTCPTAADFTLPLPLPVDAVLDQNLAAISPSPINQAISSVTFQ